MLNGYKPLKLIAGDGEDLAVVSAYLQDAVMKIGDMAYLPQKRRFAFVANRFVWENAGNRQIGSFYRVRCGVHLDDVRDVKMQHLKTEPKDAIVELLAIDVEQNDDDHLVQLKFAGGGAIRLAAESVNMLVSDISQPWRTRSRPNHSE